MEIKKILNKGMLTVKKYSPEILMGTGIVGVVVTVVTACKATLKADEVLEKHAEKMNRIVEGEQITNEEGEEEVIIYPPAVVARDKLVVYTQTGLDFARLYAPTAAIGSFSIACILVSNRILNKRYLAVVAAYNALSTSYNQYRRRVRERYGEDTDYELRYGVEWDKIEKKETDEKGKTKTKQEDVEVIDVQPSNYARYWEKYIRDGVLNPNWDENPEFNLMFLKAVQDEATRKLHARGYIFLNEVYDMLGFEHTQQGQVVGWFDDENGDGFVDFGLYNLNNRGNRRFINGQESTILLDFNCDGIIWDKI